MVQGHGIRQVAEATGISETTIRGWQRDPEFQELLEEADVRVSEAVIAETAQQEMRKIRDLAPKAREIIERTLEDPDPRLRFQASLAVLRFVAPKDGDRQAAFETVLARLDGGPSAGD